MIIQDVLNDRLLVGDDADITIRDVSGAVKLSGKWYEDDILQHADKEVLHLSLAGRYLTITVKGGINA